MNQDRCEIAVNRSSAAINTWIVFAPAELRGAITTLAVVGLLAASQPAWGYGWAAPLAIALWSGGSPRTMAVGALVGVTIGVLYGVASAAWLPASLAELGSTGWSGYIALGIIAFWVKGIPFGIVGAVLSLTLTARPLVRCVAVGIVFWILDHVAGFSSAALVPGALIGHSQIELLGVAQLALVGGVPLVSAFIAAVGTALGSWSQYPRSSQARRLALSATAAWLGLAGLGIPLCTVLAAPTASNPRSFKMAIVQPAITHGERWSKNLQAQNLSRVTAFSSQGLSSQAGIDVVVWPENMLTQDPRQHPGIANQLQRLSLELGVPVLFGTARQDNAGDQQRTYRSSIALQDVGGPLEFTIDKEIAIPILESSRSFPGSSLLQAAFGQATAWPKVREATPGLQKSALPFPIVPLLCYEALFPSLSSQRRGPAARAILNLADESWAAIDTASVSISSYGRFRAIEQRLPLVRISHDGLSLVTDRYGRVVEELPHPGWAFSIVTLPPAADATLAEKMGLLALPVGIGMLVWCISPHFGHSTRKSGG